MATKTYNPYNDAKNIVKNKGSYHNAKEQGSNYDQYKQDAVQYYQNLRNNGYGELADQLTKSNYIESLDIMKTLTPDSMASATADDYFTNLYGTTAEEQSAQKLSPAAENMWSAWNDTNTMLNGNEIKYDGNGNVVSGLNVDHYNTGKNQLGYLNNFDVTAQPYYQGIMDSFQLQGNNAARGEQASGAANNAGNIDSYAQANANRQQLAFTSAGLEAALSAANQNQQNWQSLYDSMTGHLNNVGNQNANTLNAYQNIYSTDSAERQNALNTAAALAQQEMQNKIEKYLADVGYDEAVYTADKELEGSKLAYDADTLAAQIAADADKYTANQNYAAKVYAADADRAIAEMNGTNAGTSADGYVGTNGDVVDEQTLARQMYDTYKNGYFPDVTSKYDFENLLIAAGMNADKAEEWADYYLKRDKTMFDTNPGTAASSNSSTRTVGGGLTNAFERDNY